MSSTNKLLTLKGAIKAQGITLVAAALLSLSYQIDASELSKEQLKLLVDRTHQYTKDCSRLAGLKFIKKRNRKTGEDLNEAPRLEFTEACIAKALKRDKALQAIFINNTY